MEQMNERLVDAWLKVTSVLMNHRMVKGMSFNEAFVCNLLSRRFREEPEALVTPTWLCDKTGMLKSQMNKTLNMLEEKRIINRERSEQDRRKVYIYLQEPRSGLYQEEHAEVLDFVECLKNKAGEEKVETAIEAFNSLADIVKEMEKGESGWQHKEQ